MQASYLELKLIRASQLVHALPHLFPWLVMIFEVMKIVLCESRKLLFTSFAPSSTGTTVRLYITLLEHRRSIRIEITKGKKFDVIPRPARSLLLNDSGFSGLEFC